MPAFTTNDAALARTLEWGPANHDPENPFGHAATVAALDRRDAGGDRPEDN
jgi:hypothetical protein